jgi:hypothetical protein
MVQLFSLLLREEFIGLELLKKILTWQHIGFNVLSEVKTEKKSLSFSISLLIFISEKDIKTAWDIFRGGFHEQSAL